MARWILLVEIVTYLLVMPFLRAQGELGYFPPLIVGVVAATAFAVGAFGITSLSRASVDGPPPETALGPRSSLWAVVVLLALIYAVVSLQYGLINRRQGSELMAVIFGTLPLWALAILRGYELIFLPLIVVYFLSPANIRKSERIVVGLVVVASLPFMGIADSRGRLLGMALTIVMFLTPATFMKYLVRNIRFLVAAAGVAATVAYFSAQRSNAYYSLRDYFQVEVFQRLDGLNVVTQLREAHLLSYRGEWDWNVFTPLVSKIPFLEAAQAAKIAGRTSTKQYYIQDLLRSAQLDDSNSMVTDPLYLAGLAGVLIAFGLFGYVCARFDRFNAAQPFSRSRPLIALALAFATSFFSFEGDFFGTMITAAQSFAIYLILLCAGFTYLPLAAERGKASGQKGAVAAWA